MRKIPQKLRDELAADPYYKTCARKSGECSGRITWEHAVIYAGRQVNERWAIVPLCLYAFGTIWTEGYRKIQTKPSLIAELLMRI